MATVDPEERNVALEVKSQLDSLVVSIELTLVSIVQGSAIGALIAVAQAPLLAGDWTALPALLSCLFLILIFWSRAVIHTLSFIRWPIDFLHNFLYVAVTVIEVIAINQALDPSRWFLLNSLYGLLGWALYAADLRLLRREEHEFTGENARRLYADLLRDQRINVYGLMPASVLFHLFAWWMAGRGWAMPFLVFQALFYGAYLVEGVRALQRRQGWIVQMLVDQRQGEGVRITKTEEGMDVGAGP